MTPETRDLLLVSHHTLSIDQSHAKARLGWLRGEERRAKSHVWNNPQHSSLTDRQRDNLANHAAVDLTVEFFTLEGEIEARQAELEDIRIRLAYDPVALPSE